MKILDLNSLELQSIDQVFRITVAWDKDKFQNLHFLKDQLNIVKTKAYALDSERIEFAKKYHIPFKQTYYSLEEINKFIRLLAEYEELVIEAEIRKLDWNFKRFDFRGLKEAVEKDIEEKSNTQNKQ